MWELTLARPICILQFAFCNSPPTDVLLDAVDEHKKGADAARLT
jgi:hypothetical protein